MIRNAEMKDISQLAHIEQVCFSDCWSARLLEEALGNVYDSCLVLEEAGNLLGYGVMRLIAGESEIQRLTVLPDYRRRGYARELLDYMVRISREKQAESMILEVRFSNREARSLYVSYGFREEGLRRGYYQNPTDDAVLMRYPLI